MAKKSKKKKSGAAKTDPHAIPVVKKLKIRSGGPAKVLASQVAYDGSLFRVLSEEIEEPTGK